MLKYAAQRILLMLVTLFIITLICFVLIRMLPVAVLSDNATDVAKTNAIMARITITLAFLPFFFFIMHPL